MVWICGLIEELGLLYSGFRCMVKLWRCGDWGIYKKVRIIIKGCIKEMICCGIDII